MARGRREVAARQQPIDPDHKSNATAPITVSPIDCGRRKKRMLMKPRTAASTIRIAAASKGVIATPWILEMSGCSLVLLRWSSCLGAYLDRWEADDIVGRGGDADAGIVEFTDDIAAHCILGAADAMGVNDEAHRQLSSIHEDGVIPLLSIAREWNGEQSVDDQIRARKPGLEADDETFGFTKDDRDALGFASTKGKWFKTVSYAEMVGRDVVGPHLAASSGALVDTLEAVRAWIQDAPAEDDGL